MKDLLKSFAYGVTFAVGFFAAISFTADAELDAAQEQAELVAAYEKAAFLEGVVFGAREATINKQCGLMDVYRKPAKGVM